MRKFALFISILFTSSIILSQEQFDKHLLLKGSFPSTDFINFIQVADMDGDGDDDVVAAARDRVVGWYPNIDGQGNFGNLILVDDKPREVISLDVADLDSDGLLDILIASSDNKSVTWYKNLGNGQISSDILFVDLNLESLTSAKAADFDGDGDQDVVFASANNDRLEWCENTDGQGNFADPVPIFIGSKQNAPTHLNTADLDGNGAVDLVVGGANSLYVYYNDGAATFTREILQISPTGTRPVHAFADYDGDGDLDIVTGVNNIEWLKNEQGSFLPATNLHSGKTTFLGSGDIDNDGDLDIYSIHDASRSFIWLENVGAFLEAVEHEVMEDLIFPNRIAVSDIDNDGDLDAIISAQSGHLAQLRNMDGNGTFERVDDVNAQLQWATDIRSADIDGDGDLDAIISDQTGNRVDWYENINGDGLTMKQHNIVYELDGASTVVTADVDNDGDLDVIACAGNDVNLIWFENIDGAGDFGPMNLIAENLGADQHLHVADIDGNGFIDIVARLESGRKMSLFRNVDGVFLPEEEIFDIAHEFTATTLADIDGDGDMDIVAAQKALVRIFWSENLDGNGDFSLLKAVVKDVDIINNIHTADVDGDLDLDIVYTREEGVSWIENLDGIGNFGEIQEIDQFTFSQSDIEFADVEDMDGDGDKDIVISSRDGLFWYENHGYASGRWSAKIEIESLDEAAYIICHANDFSGNGINDVLTFSLSNRALYFFSNKLEPQNYITGIVNLNPNDTCTISDTPVPDILVTSTNGSESFSSLTNKNGRFLNKVPLGTFTSFITQVPNGYIDVFSEFNSTITEDNTMDSLLFCLMTEGTDTVAIFDDLMVTVFPVTQARPGFDVTYQIVYKNLGRSTLSDSITLSYMSSLIDYLSSTEEPELLQESSIRWRFEDLKPFETRKINVKFNVKPPPTVSLSTILRFQANIYPIESDSFPIDNTHDMFNYVVGSYDPNDITVLEGSEIEYQDYLRPDTLDYLHYVIRFQNTGTASAINVRIANILDSNLDWTTFQPISSSHDSRIEIINQDSVNFVFDGIYLPDSTTDLVGSQGFVTYRIQPKTDLAIGAIIRNDAEIYFDFNEPIVTNEVATELISTVNTEDISKEWRLFIHPNPSNDVAYLGKGDELFDVILYNQQGVVLKSISKSRKLDLSSLASGIYFVKATDSIGEIYRGKLVKM